MLKQENQAALSFQVGDRVMVRDPALRQAPGSKLLPSWKGPCKILKKGKSGSTYMIQQEGGGFTGTKNITHIKKFFQTAPRQSEPAPIAPRGPTIPSAQQLVEGIPMQVLERWMGAQEDVQQQQAVAPALGPHQQQQQVPAHALPEPAQEQEVQAEDDHAQAEEAHIPAGEVEGALQGAVRRSERKKTATTSLNSGDFLLKF